MAEVITLGYVRCQDLRQSFDSPDQLVMVIRAPPETQMQVSEPSEVKALIHFSQVTGTSGFQLTVHICLRIPGLPGVAEEHARTDRRLPLS